MPIKPTTQVGNPIIRTTSLEVTNIQDTAIQELIQDLIDSLRAADLVGMAACQIGVNLRIFVTEIRDNGLRKGEQLSPLQIYINPKIVNASEEMEEGWEGCGSVAHAELFSHVPRHTALTIEALNEQGVPFTKTYSGFLARIIQHEMDHLNGKIFLDSITDTSTLASREEYIRIQQGA